MSSAGGSASASLERTSAVKTRFPSASTPATRRARGPALAALAVAAALAATPLPAAPRFACDGTEFNFGTADSSQTVEHTFVIRNDGDATLEIKDLRTNCGCTVAQIENPALAPGDSRDIHATLILLGTSGPQGKSVMFRTNDPDHAVVRLVLSGVVGKSYDLTPADATFGEVPATESATLTLDVASRVGAPILDVKLRGTAPGVFDVTVKRPRFGGKDKAAITVLTRPPLTPGIYRDELLITFGPPASFTLPVRVVARVPEPMRVLPSTLSLAEGRDVEERYLLILQGAVRGFKVQRVVLPPGIDKAETDELPSGDWRIRLVGLHGRPSLDGQAISILTDNPTFSTITVPVTIVPAELGTSGQ
ncbi:MAG: hypothetical protein BWZ02_02532 [Lentisphaerae bacterium ADurb.BinA184]|nr:MAG: hypothetical protein BWZ02_02532 [Lentisphaerae bacterium ADurb.BinA184]